MLGNFVLVGVIITLIWIVCYGLYLYVSSQQQHIVQDMEQVEKKLNKR